MKELASTIMWIFCVCLLMFACEPEGIGQNSAKIKKAFNQEMKTPTTDGSE